MPVVPFRSAYNLPGDAIHIEDFCDGAGTIAGEALVILKELQKSLGCFWRVEAEHKEDHMFEEGTWDNPVEVHYIYWGRYSESCGR